MTILVTGGAGFIGSNFVINWLNKSQEKIVNIDKLTYAGNLKNLESIISKPIHIFVEGCIGNETTINNLLYKYKPRAIVNFAAETHVDKSINNPKIFIDTNISSNFTFLNCAYLYWLSLNSKDRNQFRFLHISTDEVFGDLLDTDQPFDESSQYQPNNPYSATKASGDHLVRAFNATYGLPTLTINSSNNYGPFQFPEKLIPLMITHALSGKSLPVYGDGLQIRDWIYVDDHCNAIQCILDKGKIGQSYNIGGCNEKTNIEIVKIICSILDELIPNKNKNLYEKQITFVQDREGHDRRYGVNISKVMNELGWKPQETFESGIRKTILWYLNNQDWFNDIKLESHINSAQQYNSNRS
jgi:dTDP-glucose 4,6-dehydratase